MKNTTPCGKHGVVHEGRAKRKNPKRGYKIQRYAPGEQSSVTMI